MTAALRIATATAFAAIVFIPTVVYSGAPMRVHLVNAMGLALAFWLPALAIENYSFVKKHAWLLAAAVIVGTTAWHVGTSIVVAKYEFSAGALAHYPLALIGSFLLFLLHAGFVDFVSGYLSRDATVE